MGPDQAADVPVAVSKPIFVDVYGNGFTFSGDPLGKLPVKGANDWQHPAHHFVKSHSFPENL